MNNTCFFNLEMDNLTFDDTTISSDKYVGVYESVHIRFAFLTTYMVILVFAPLLAFVIWFERSGQAGSYRTMVNQLASFNLDQVHFFPIFAKMYLKNNGLTLKETCYGFLPSQIPRATFWVGLLAKGASIYHVVR